MQQGRPFVKKGQFYFIFEGNESDLILEDKTKRGLEVKERSFDDKYGVESEKGIIHDMDGIGRRVGIRWYFPKKKYSLNNFIYCHFYILVYQLSNIVSFVQHCL